MPSITIYFPIGTNVMLERLAEKFRSTPQMVAQQIVQEALFGAGRNIQNWDAFVAKLAARFE